MNGWSSVWARRPSWSILACVAFGGAIGALTRYGFSEAFIHQQKSSSIDASFNQFTNEWFVSESKWLPVSTIVSNIIGCFLIGVFQNVFTHYDRPLIRATLMTGFCGALTTMSSLALDVANLSQNTQTELKSNNQSNNQTIKTSLLGVGDHAGMTIAYLIISNIGGIIAVCLGLLIADEVIRYIKPIPDLTVVKVEMIVNELPIPIVEDVEEEVKIEEQRDVQGEEAAER